MIIALIHNETQHLFVMIQTNCSRFKHISIKTIQIIMKLYIKMNLLPTELGQKHFKWHLIYI